MIKKPKDWDHVQAAAERRTLPPGAYVCRIMDAKIRQYQGAGGPFEKLEISLEIEEGELRGFFAQDYRDQTREDKKWRGTLRLYLPTDDKSEQDGRTQRNLKAAVTAVEASNPGYHWDWEEQSLKGKLVGGVFRSEEWAFDGRSGFSTQCCWLRPAGEVRDGKVEAPPPKRLPGRDRGQGGYAALPASDDDLPF